MKLCKRPLRESVAEVILATERDLLVASPYIKFSEAEWIVGLMKSRPSFAGIRATVLTDIRTESVLSGSLDVEALSLLSNACSSRVVTLPRLHAKVYIADSRLALVTSANLTPSGLDANFEYGLCVDMPEYVARVRADLEAYSRVGNTLDSVSLSQLSHVAKELADSYKAVQNSAQRRLKQTFGRHLRKATHVFLEAQVGRRTASSLFGEAILYILSPGPMTTRELHPRVQQLLPDLCNDEVELVINGERFGKKWKHGVRNAQQALKRSGEIVFDGREWARTPRTKR